MEKTRDELRAERVARITARITQFAPASAESAQSVESALDAVDRRTMVEIYRLAAQAVRAIPGSTIDASDLAHNVILDIADNRKDGAKTIQLMRDGSSEGYRRMRVLLAQRLISDAKRDGMWSRSAEIVRWANSTEADQTLPKTHRQRVTVEDGPRRMSHGPLAHRDRAERELVTAAIEASKDYSTLGVISGGTNPNRPGDVRQLAEESETIWQGNGGPRSDRDPNAAFLRESGVMARNVRETTIDRRMEISNLAAKGRTQVVKGVTRLDRSQSLEDMLTSLNEQKVHRVFDPSETDYYLVGPLGRRLADKWDIAQFRAVFPGVLNETAANWSGRGKSQIADALARIAARDADAWRKLAVMMRNVEQQSRPTSEGAPTTTTTATKEQKQAAAIATTAAAARTSRAAHAAQLAHHLAILAADRPITLADVVLAAVVAEHAAAIVTRSGPTGRAERRPVERTRLSGLDLRSVCAVIGLPERGNGAMGLRSLVQTAASTALDRPVALSQSPGRWSFERELRALVHPTSTVSGWMQVGGHVVRTQGVIRTHGPVDVLPAPVVTPDWLRDIRRRSAVTPTTPTFGLPAPRPRVGAAPELPVIVVTGDQTPTPRAVLRERLDAYFARPARDEGFAGRWVR